VRLRQIEVFHAVYSSGSMTNAAAMLNVSQPSVSKVLAHAEQQLGYRLFDRVKGKLVPTPEAHQLIQHVKIVYEDIDRLRHVATNIRDNRAGRIRVAGTPAFGLEVLPRAAALYQQSNPGVVFEIETLNLDELNDALLESHIDIGLCLNPKPNPGIREQRLAGGRFVVLAPDDGTFDDRQEMTISDLAEYPFIALHSRGPLERALSDYISTNKTELNIVAWTDPWHVAKSLVAFGSGLTIVDDITARSDLSRNVRRIPLRPALRFNVMALQFADAPLSIGAKRFTKHLGTYLKEFLADD
jgi:DNA-binding transcriptional LysR family regulator